MARRLLVSLIAAACVCLTAGCPPPTPKQVAARVFDKATLKPVPFQVYLYDTFKAEIGARLVAPALADKVLQAGQNVVVIDDVDRMAGDEDGRPVVALTELLSIEDGFIGALTAGGLVCHEKTGIRTVKSEPDEGGAFYIAPLTDAEIKALKEAAVDKAVLFRVMGMAETDNLPPSKLNLVRVYLVYVRIIDVATGTVARSDMFPAVSEPDLKSRLLGEVDQKAFKALEEQADPGRTLEAFTVTRQVMEAAVPAEVVRSLSKAAVINEGYLQLGQDYRLGGQATPIEDAVVAALARFSSKAVAEKFGKIQLKLSWQYLNMVFYMNPLCYRTWNEIIQKHGFQQLVLYRVVDYKGGSKTVPARAAVFLKVIDLQKGGRVVWAGLAQGEDAAWTADPSADAAKAAQERADRVPAEERAVVASTGLFGKLLGDLPAGTLKESDQILLLNTDDVAVDKNYLTVSGKDLAAEDGVVTALVTKGFGVVEKLASIYINPAEEYAGKAFYINPLFLKNLDSLLEYSGSKINKIVAYKKIEVEAVAAVQPAGFAGTTVKTKGSEVAGLYVRVIDVGDGNIVFSGIVQNN